MRFLPQFYYQSRGAFDPQPGASYDTESLAIFAAFTTPPSTQRKSDIDTLVKALKASSIWTPLDVLYLYAAADSQAGKVNWKNPGTFDCTAVNSPTFTADRGFAGDGSTSYLDTNWAAATNAVSYTQNSASAGAWSRTARAATNHSLLGADGASTHTNLYNRYGSDVTYARINANPEAGSVPNANSDGLFVADRASSSSRSVYRNGSTLGATSETSGSVPSSTLRFGGNFLTGFGMFDMTTDQLAAGLAGASLGSTGQANLYTALQAYMTAVGA